MYRIFIVEDDPVIASAIRERISAWGCEARCCEDFDAVMREFAAFNPHLVLLDISLPFFNGYHWCREIRKVSQTPVVFISSTSDNMNIVMAMDMGGDDFIAKPFDMEVLTAKVRSLLRRTYDFALPAELIECAGAVLDLGDGSLSYGGEKIDLTKNEYRILRTLLERKGRVVSRETLMTALWETDSFVDENTLTVNVTRLRKKLDAAGVPELIKTKKGVGYIAEG